MAAMYAAQQEVIVALTEVGEVERWLAAHLPICCMCLVPPPDDPLMVARHVSMVGRSNYVEPCHHPAVLVGWLA